MVGDQHCLAAAQFHLGNLECGAAPRGVLPWVQLPIGRRIQNQQEENDLTTDVHRCRRLFTSGPRLAMAGSGDKTALLVEPEAETVGERKIVIPFVLLMLGHLRSPNSHGGRTAALEEMAEMR